MDRIIDWFRQTRVGRLADRTGAASSVRHGCTVGRHRGDSVALNRRGILSGLASLPFVGRFSANSESAPLPRIPYATEGEAITCENGHFICDFVKTVYEGDLQDVATQLGNWQQSQPDRGTIPLPRCAICGARWTLGSIYHVEGAWRDPHHLIEKYGMLDPLSGERQ